VGLPSALWTPALALANKRILVELAQTQPNALPPQQALSLAILVQEFNAQLARPASLLRLALSVSAPLRTNVIPILADKTSPQLLGFSFNRPVSALSIPPQPWAIAVITAVPAAALYARTLLVKLELVLSLTLPEPTLLWPHASTQTVAAMSDALTPDHSVYLTLRRLATAV
jgi:hypothetical protein